MASKEEKAREPVKPYEFREGMVRKGGLKSGRIPNHGASGTRQSRSGRPAASALPPRRKSRLRRLPRLGKGPRRPATTLQTDPRRLQEHAGTGCA